MPSPTVHLEMSPAGPTLEDLIAPLRVPDFLEILRSRTLTFRPCSGNLPFQGVCNWDLLRTMIESGAVPAEKLRITHKQRPVPAVMFTSKGKVQPSMLAGLFAQGASLFAEPLAPHVPALEALCREMGKRLREQVKVGAVVTTGSGGALTKHYDPFDLIIAQIEGSKRWTVYRTPTPNPVEGMPPQPPPPEGELLFDGDVRPGDFLFVPAGYWHQCENGLGLSLHLAIGIRPPAAWHALETLLPKLLAEPLMRVPLTRLGEAELEVHQEAVKQLVISVVGRASLSALIDERRSASLDAAVLKSVERIES